MDYHDAQSSRAGSTRPSYTERLANYAAEFRYQQLPRAVQNQARLVALDTLGAMLGASSPEHQAGDMLCRVIAEQGEAPQATIVGRSQKASSINAALANGTFGYYLDVESLHPGAIMHGAAIVLPAALSIAESRGLSGANLAEAVVLGIDVACRVSHAVGPKAMYARGFHPTAVCGTFGAAAAVGNLLRLDPQRQANAFGLAATQAAGLLAWASDPTELSKPLNTGIAARNGVSAALLAEAGFGAPHQILDPTSKYNVYRAWSDTPQAAALVEALHERYAIMELAFKRYACCGFLHPALDGILAILESGRATQDEVEGITLRFARTGTPIIDNNPLKSHRAQFILPIGLLRRRVSVDDLLHYSESDQRFDALCERVRVVPDDELERLYPDRYTSIVELSLRDGRTETERVDWPRGYPQNPLSAEEIEDKFLGLATGIIGHRAAERVVQLVRRLEELDDLEGLMSELAG